MQHTKESIKEMIIGTGILQVTNRNGEDFAIVDGYPDIDRCLYMIAEALAPESIQEYRDFHDPINNHQLIQGDRLVTYGSLSYAGCAVPEVLEVALEKAGIEDIWFENIVMEYGFSDQYCLCGGCNKPICHFPSSGSPDTHYHHNGEMVCVDCFKSNGLKDEYLETCINNPRGVVQFDLVSFDELYAEGFEKHHQSPYHNGLHKGMNDVPEEVMKKLNEEGFDEVLFTLDENTSFHMTFSAWVRRKEGIEGKAVISPELRDEIIETASRELIPYDVYEGVLNDSFILYGAKKIAIEGINPTEYIVLHNKYVNVWTSETELIATNDIQIVNIYKELFGEGEEQ